MPALWLPTESIFNIPAVLPSKLDDNDVDMQGELEQIPLVDELHDLIVPNDENLPMQQVHSVEVASNDIYESLDSFKFEEEPEEVPNEKSPVVVAVADELSEPIEQEYEILQRFDEFAYVRNVEEFKCSMCLKMIAPLEGIVLRECIHEFCTQCLFEYICTVDKITVKCPYKSDAYNCNEFVQHRDLRAILPEIQFNSLLDDSIRVRNAYLILYCHKNDLKFNFRSLKQCNKKNAVLS